jgi:transposase
MAAVGLSMRMLREVLRLYLALGMTGRAIGRSCGLSASTVSGYLGRARVARLTWPAAAGAGRRRGAHAAAVPR